VPRLTPVTLDCTLFDITKSVAEAVAGVYSLAVLRLRGHTWRSDEGAVQDDARLRATSGPGTLPTWVTRLRGAARSARSQVSEVPPRLLG
jgi:hypothetical protein